MTKAQSLFEQYRKECGMDDDDLKAARWYKDGLIEFADWLLQQKCEQCNVSGSLPPDDYLAFVEYCGEHYVKMHGGWMQRFADQRNIANLFTTKQLYALWRQISC